jgi:hypothetical protein
MDLERKLGWFYEKFKLVWKEITPCLAKHKVLFQQKYQVKIKVFVGSKIWGPTTTYTEAKFWAVTDLPPLK